MLFSIALKTLAGEIILYLIEIVLSIVFLKILLIDLKKETKSEHKYSVYFFMPLFVLIQFSWLLQPIFLEQNNLLYFFGFIITIFLYVIFFRVAFGRPYTHAKVLLSDNKMAVVETDFDIRSFSVAGKHIIKTDKKIAAGKTIKVQLKTSFFGKKNIKTSQYTSIDE